MVLEFFQNGWFCQFRVYQVKPEPEPVSQIWKGEREREREEGDGEKRGCELRLGGSRREEGKDFYYYYIFGRNGLAGIRTLVVWRVGMQERHRRIAQKRNGDPETNVAPKIVLVLFFLVVGDFDGIQLLSMCFRFDYCISNVTVILMPFFVIVNIVWTWFLMLKKLNAPAVLKL
jgi:hypothetical protein